MKTTAAAKAVPPIAARSTSLAPPPTGWRWARLTEAARIESGHTPSRRHPEYWNGTTPWLSLKDIRSLSGNYILDTVDKPTLLGIDHSSARILPKGTVALCRTASVGNAVILGRDMATSQDFVNWVCGPELVPEYLLHALRASATTFATEKQGTTHKTIYMPVLSRLWVLLPPSTEQCRIAALLDKADAIRRKREDAIQLIDDLLRSSFLEIFGDPVSNPKGWVVKTGNELFADLTYGTSRKCSTARGPGDLPVLRIPNVTSGRIVLGDLKYASLPDAEARSVELRYDDLLFVRTNGNPGLIGRCAVFDGEEKTLFASYLIRGRIAEAAACCARFLQAVASFPTYRARLVREARTTAGNYNLSAAGLRRLPFICPPVALQQAYLKIIQATASLRETSTGGRRLNEGLFASLVGRAFRGELTLPLATNS